MDKINMMLQKDLESVRVDHSDLNTVEYLEK